MKHHKGSVSDPSALAEAFAFAFPNNAASREKHKEQFKGLIGLTGAIKQAKEQMKTSRETHDDGHQSHGDTKSPQLRKESTK